MPAVTLSEWSIGRWPAIHGRYVSNPFIPSTHCTVPHRWSPPHLGGRDCTSILAKPLKHAASPSRYLSVLTESPSMHPYQVPVRPDLLSLWRSSFSGKAWCGPRVDGWRRVASTGLEAAPAPPPPPVRTGFFWTTTISYHGPPGNVSTPSLSQSTRRWQRRPQSSAGPCRHERFICPVEPDLWSTCQSF